MDRFSNIVERTEERIFIWKTSRMKHSHTPLPTTGNAKHRRIQKTEDTVKKTNTSAIGVPGREEKENGTETIPEEVIPENIPKLIQEVISQNNKYKYNHI